MCCLLDDNKARAGSLWLMEVIKKAMELHVFSEMEPQVSEQGLGALQNICGNSTCVKFYQL